MAANAPETDANPVLHSHRRRELSGELSSSSRAILIGGLLEFGEQRSGDEIERQGGRDGVSRHADDRGRRHDTKNDRVSRLDGNAVCRNGADPLEHRSGVVAPSGRRSSKHEHDVGFLACPEYGFGQHLWIVRENRELLRLGACLMGLAGQHERVGVAELAGCEGDADGLQFISRGKNRDDRSLIDEHVRCTAGRDRSEINCS